MDFSSLLVSPTELLQGPYISLLAGLLNFFLGVVALNRNSTSTINRIYAMAAFSIALWGSADFMERTSQSAMQALVWERVSSIGYILAPLLQCAFGLYFVGVNSITRKTILGFFGLFSFLALLLVWNSNLIYNGVHQYSWGFTGREGELFIFLTALLFVEMGLVAFVYFKTAITTKEISKRKQAITLFIGALLPVTIGLYTDGILPIFQSSFIEFGALATTLNTLFIALAIVRFGFLGIGIEVAAPFVLGTLADAVFITNTDGRIVYANMAAQKMAKAEENAILLKQIRDFLPELPAGAFSKFFNSESIFSNHKKEKISVRVLLQRIADISTGIKGNVVTLQDLTEIKKLQEVEAVSRAEAEATRHGTELVESAGEGILSVDKDGRINLWNAAMTKLTGYSTEEVLGKSLKEGLHLVDKSRLAFDVFGEVLSKVFSQKKSINLSFVDGFFLLDKNDARIAVEITASPLLHEDGNIYGVVIVVSDETREFKADRIKSEFVSIASHQLRTPLSTIKWFSEMMSHGDVGELNKSQQAFIDDILSSVERVINTVNMLLNVSRIEQETLAVVPEITDLVKLVGVIIEEAKLDMEQKNLNISFDVKDNFPLIKLDPRLIRFVLENLIQNAIRYSFRDGNIAITMEKDKEFVKISVVDHGYGIPKDEQSRIFQKFFRASNAQAIIQDGTGLGLFIAKSAIELSGGTIWFVSEKDKGTTFSFTIPLEGSRPKDGFKQLS